MTGAGIATVARQEFRLRIRAGRWKWLLTIFFLVLLGFTALLRGALSSVTEQDVPFKGTVVYGGLMLFVLGLALLVVPALAAQSVNGDRERGTLATLQVTLLSAAEITLGKFVAAWGTALVFLALTFPLVGYAMTQNGVPFLRVLVVTLVLALLLGTVCAVSLWWSAVLSRTTTSGVLAYLTVFTLTVGTLIVFGLVTAVTAERYTQTYENECPPPPPGVPAEQFGCVDGPVTYQTSRARTDRTWWLLAPNPFVVLADAAPQIPDEPVDPRQRDSGVRARDLDPLGQIGRAVRQLRTAPADRPDAPTPFPSPASPVEPEQSAPVWPTGLAVNVALGVGALTLTTRRLRTPTRTLPRGQRVA